MSIPATMFAVRLTGVGGLDKLEPVRLPVPQPADGEVLVKVGATGLNNSDVMLRIGGYGREDDPQATTSWKRDAGGFPVIQGSDIAGEIVAVGHGVDGGRVGERVLVNPSLYRIDGSNPVDLDYLGSERDGGYAEYVSVPAANAHPVSDRLSLAEWATFPVSYLTALHMLNRARVAAGETVLVTGASGGVGSALLQLLAARDARAIAVVGNGKADQALALGALATIPRDTADLAAAVEAVNGGRPVDVVADVVAGPAFGTLLQALRAQGRYVTSGAIGGSMVSLDVRTLYLKHLDLLGSSYGTAAEFAELIGLIEAGTIRPLLARTYPLKALREAQEAFLAKQHFGKLVVVP